MNQKPKILDVRVVYMPEFCKRWVKAIVHGKVSWAPSFEQLFEIIHGICLCEDEKYPNGRGRGMVADFLVDCCKPAANWSDLAAKYKMPIRK